MKPPSEFWNNPHGQMTLMNINVRGSEYWAQNVYKYYSMNTGKLGQACEVVLKDDRIVATMKPLYSTRGGMLHDYGPDLMNGIPPGTGKYSPKKGYRLKYGEYPGVSVDKFWKPWMAEFEPALREIVREEVLSGLKNFIREQLSRSAKR